MVDHLPDKRSPVEVAEKVDRITSSMLEAMRDLPDNIRRRVIENLKAAYCFECGCERPATGRMCQCWNDE